MARFPRAIPFGCLLAFAMAFAPATGRAADGDAKASEAVTVNRRKLERIIIPKLEFREATFREALDFLIKKAAELDTDSAEGKRGLNVVVKLESASGDGIPGQPVANLDERRITVSLTNVSLLVALRYVTTLANLRFEIGPNLISIVPLSPPAGEIVTKEWKVPRDLIPGVPPDPGKAVAGEEATVKNVDRETAKNWLIANGVTFDGAASAVYIVKSSRLIVRNRQEQLDLVDTILHIGEAPSPLVEIECRLVQVERVDMKRLSFDETVKALNSPAKKSSQGILRDASGAPSLSPDAVESWINPSSNSGTVAGVFTDPQFQLVVRALMQKKGAEIFTAPRILVKSGGSAVIRFVHQYSNPVEDVPPQVRSLVSSANASAAVARKKASAESSVSAREGNRTVTLKVEPAIGPDGYTIDLGMTTQVTESDDFVSYMSPFRWTNLSYGPAGRIVTPQFAPTAVFSTRKVTTTVSVFDCSTVMLSDLLGRVTDGPPKKRLILCVSASLHNAPHGPVSSEDEKEEVITTDPTKAPAKELPLMPTK